MELDLELPKFNSSKPFISICVTNYNNLPYLQKMFDSLVGSTFENWEWAIIDDNSTDYSQPVIEKIIQDNPILQERLFYEKYSSERRGACVLRNEMFKKASGEYIMFMDSDDFFNPKGLEEIWRRTSLSPVWCHFGFDIYSDIDDRREQTRFIPMKSLYDIFFPYMGHSCGIVMKREFVESELGYLDERLTFAGSEDLLWLAKAYKLHPFGGLSIDYPIMYYRINKPPRMYRNYHKDRTSWKKYEILFNEIPELKEWGICDPQDEGFSHIFSEDFLEDYSDLLQPLDSYIISKRPPKKKDYRTRPPVLS